MKEVFLVDEGVLLNRDDKSFEMYAYAYDNQYGYYDEDQFYVESKEDAIKQAKEYVEDGAENTYAIVSDSYVSDDNDLTILEDESYLPEDVIYSVAKINGNIVENFVKSDLKWIWTEDSSFTISKYINNVLQNQVSGTFILGNARLGKLKFEFRRENETVFADLYVDGVNGCVGSLFSWKEESIRNPESYIKYSDAFMATAQISIMSAIYMIKTIEYDDEKFGKIKLNLINLSKNK